jgi:LuxR family transcriptional regulator, regulator of acetate metabolism
MTVQCSAEAPPGLSISRVLNTLRPIGNMDMLFGGWVRRDASTLEITHLNGAKTRSLANLRIRPGEGLGGKAVMMRRPVSVDSYLSAQGITHVFDNAVSAERLETVVALPIVVEDVTRMVIYLGNRSRVDLGDRWFDTFAPVVRKLVRDISVEDEVRRRLSLLTQRPDAESSPPANQNMGEIVEELDELAGMITDEAVLARIEHLRSRFERVPSHDERRERVELTRRESEVLAQVAHGCTNQKAAENLGLMPNTVKSYMKSAMRKLNAENRVQAMLAARDAGLVD